MKKIILITIVCLLIPSFGIFNQASASNFSIEGTLWRTTINRDTIRTEGSTIYA